MHFFRRTSPNEYKLPGILDKDASGQWVLYAANKVKLSGHKRASAKGSVCVSEAFDDLIEGQKVYYRVSTQGRRPALIAWYGSNPALPSDAPMEGYLHKGYELGSDKRSGAAFSYRLDYGKKQSVPLADGAIRRLSEVMEIYDNPKINRTHGGYGKFDVHAERYLVYYSTGREGADYKAKYLSPACVTKEVFENTLGTALPEEFLPCQKKELCPACKLFGRVSTDFSNAGRIRFTDALPVSALPPEAYYDPPVIILATSGPKPSTAEFYTVKPDEKTYWTYDYSAVKNKNIINRMYLRKGAVQPRGRKFYWHGALSGRMENGDRPLEKLEMRALPLKRGVELRGRVYFDGVSHGELVWLLWCMTLGGSDKHAHKIGHGKPWGFGSIQISEVKVMCRTIDRETCAHTIAEYKAFDELRKDFASMDLPADRRVAAREDLLGIMQLDFGKDNPGFPGLVCYPLGEDKIAPMSDENRSASHQWFAGNREGVAFKRVLPTIREELSGGAEPHLTKMEKHRDGEPRGGQPRTPVRTPGPYPQGRQATPPRVEAPPASETGSPVTEEELRAKLLASGMVKPQKRR